MNDYSDLFYLMGAMLVFSMLSVNTANSFLRTSQATLQSDVEYRAIAFAQDEIDQVKLLSRDKENLLKSDHNSYMFGDYPKTITPEYGASNEYSETFTVSASSTLINENDLLVNRYLVTVIVTQSDNVPAITARLTFIKAFEK